MTAETVEQIIGDAIAAFDGIAADELGVDDYIRWAKKHAKSLRRLSVVEPEGLKESYSPDEWETMDDRERGMADGEAHAFDHIASNYALVRVEGE